MNVDNAKMSHNDLFDKNDYEIFKDMWDIEYFDKNWLNVLTSKNLSDISDSVLDAVGLDIWEQLVDKKSFEEIKKRMIARHRKMVIDKLKQKNDKNINQLSVNSCFYLSNENKECNKNENRYYYSESAPTFSGYKRKGLAGNLDNDNTYDDGVMTYDIDNENDNENDLNMINEAEIEHTLDMPPKKKHKPNN